MTRKLLSCVSLILLVACSQSAIHEQALVEIRDFHEHFNKREFPAMYDALDAEGRKNITLEQFVKGMTAMRERQGAIVESKELSTDYYYAVGVSKIRIIVSVTYEKGTAGEEFVFSRPNGKIGLSGYRFLG